MKEFLYWAVGIVARIHGQLMQINDSFERSFTDKELHFLVIGLLGMGMIFVIYPIFRALARKGWIMLVTWIYVFTLIVVIVFAIEIGQKITHTGAMEFADIMSGIIGFLAMFLVFSILRGIWNAIGRRLRQRNKNR